jgi:hypothetical protein
MPVDSTKVQGRRELRFASLDDILADVEKLAQGKVRALGNWPPGTILKHVAVPMVGSIDGFALPVPWWGRIFGWLFKRRILTSAMPPGFRLSANAEKMLVFPGATWEEGVMALRTAIQRLKTESKRERSPFLGALTAEEWNLFHCRHAELHLSFLVTDA